MEFQIIIIAILLAEYVFNLWLDAKNARSWSPGLPAGSEGIYDAERYERARQYFLANYRFGKITSAVSVLALLILLLAGGFGQLDMWVKTKTASPAWQALLFFGVLALASDLLSTPFSIYRTFVIEEKFGFNKTTLRTYVLDKLKGYVLSALIGGGILFALVSLYAAWGRQFWIFGWAVMSLFTILAGMFYTTLLLPLFNRLVPLPEGALRESIHSYCSGNGFTLRNIFVMDGSRRSTKANAFFSGLGPRKTIVLYDTLVKDYSVEELTAVLAHEVGHYRKRHTQKAILLSVLNTGLLLFVFSLCINSVPLAQALGTTPSFHINALVFALLYSPMSALTGIFMHSLSRKHEFEADRFARETYGGMPLSTALKKLSADNLSNLTPDPVYVYMHYSHPPVLQRLKALM